LHGMGVAPDAAAKIFWMKNTGEVYVDPSNLPELQPGKQFQLWAIVDGKPVDAGMILTSKQGDKYRIQKMRSFGKAEAFAITIEKAGGSPTPTMDQMVVMGKM
jgi:anti-sigma-K factor RskA